MKVAMVKKEDRRFYTSEELDVMAKAVTEALKADEWTVKGYAEMAAREACRDAGCTAGEILQASAHVAGNCRIHDAIAEGTGRMDVWIEAIARTSHGFVEFGAYLTDVWQTGAVHYQNHMYIRHARFDD